MWDDTVIKEQNVRGIIGHLWGSTVHVSDLTPKDYIFFLPHSEYLGVMPIRNKMLLNNDTYIEDSSMAIMNDDYISAIKIG